MENKKLTFKELMEIYKREMKAEEEIQNFEETIENNREKISNFKELIEAYYKKTNDKDVVFDFMHVIVDYTYIELGKRIITLHQDSTVSVGYRDERVKRRETIFVPFITSKEFYQNNLSDDSYYTKRTLAINDTIDIGSSYNFHYDEIIKKIYEIMPKECQIISENELGIIAKEHGYDRFEWNIYDEAVGVPPIFYGGPMWVNEIYGVKEKDYETIEDSKKVK